MKDFLKQMQKIPLSDHIDYALDSLEIAEKRSEEKGDFEVKMGKYHDVATVDDKPICIACLAGISMMNRVGMLESGFAKNEDQLSRDSGVPLEELDAYEAALDCLRSGFPFDALSRLNGSMADRYHITNYRTNPEAFKSDMKNMSISLREQGY